MGPKAEKKTHSGIGQHIMIHQTDASAEGARACVVRGGRRTPLVLTYAIISFGIFVGPICFSVFASFFIGGLWGFRTAMVEYYLLPKKAHLTN